MPQGNAGAVHITGDFAFMVKARAAAIVSQVCGVQGCIYLKGLWQELLGDQSRRTPRTT